MAKYRKDEGSNSDSSSGSLKEITADDFKQHDSRSRVWIYNQPVNRNYNQDLYSFAWAQAVQNKPLGIDVKPLKVDDEDDVEMFVQDNEGEGEKEEGEIEEGEIGLGSDSMTNPELNVVKIDESEKVLDLEEKVEEIGDFDKRFGVILEELETITEEEAQAKVCSRLQKCFASLKEMFSEGHGPILDVLVQQAFVGIQTVCSAYSSGNLKKMDQNKELLIRSLIHIKNQHSGFLSTEQVKEIDVRVHALASESVTIVKTTDTMTGSPYVAQGPVRISVEKPLLDPRGSNHVGSDTGKVSLSKLQPPTNSRSIIDFSPLLNLHEAHDEDNLPSPTRDNAPPLPVLKPIGFGIGAAAPAQLHPYVSDAFKAVSSYQQKHRKKFYSYKQQAPQSNPSEDGNASDDDINSEVSSSAVASSFRSFGPKSTTASPNNLPGLPQMLPVKSIGQVVTKSRDPRLRFLNPENGLAAGLTNSRKHKAADDEPVQDDHNLKRQRNGSNGISVPNTSNTTSPPAVSLPSLLNDIAVNPAMLMQLVKMEQQRIATEAQKKADDGPLCNTQNDTGKIRMKPRDPRRILHSNVLQKSASSDNLTVREQGEQAQPIESKSANSWGDMDHLLVGYGEQEKAAIQKERVRRIAEQNKMFAAHKLCLVLDLDHTLLNSAKFGEVDQVHEEILRKKEEQDKQKPQRHLYRFPHMGMWTKLRPGVWKFLEQASQLYELHVYTMGNKLYATEMARVLDPTGKLFSGRVISRGDDNDSIDGDDRVPKSKDLDGVLGMESAVVIIDDSVRVWPHNKLNLIAVERYTYFPSSRQQFGLLGPSLLEIDHDERPEDGTLASSLAVIERIHRSFFSHTSLNEVDVRNILAAEQRKILSGCRIVFSRVFPVGEAKPQLHPLWQTAQQFGAECTNHIDERVTHVVANSLGTDKVNWALSTGRFVVHPGWVEASALLYRRANEQDFAIKI